MKNKNVEIIVVNPLNTEKNRGMVNNKFNCDIEKLLF